MASPPSSGRRNETGQPAAESPYPRFGPVVRRLSLPGHRARSDDETKHSRSMPPSPPNPSLSDPPGRPTRSAATSRLIRLPVRCGRECLNRPRPLAAPSTHRTYIDQRLYQCRGGKYILLHNIFRSRESQVIM